MIELDLRRERRLHKGQRPWRRARHAARLRGLKIRRIHYPHPLPLKDRFHVALKEIAINFQYTETFEKQLSKRLPPQRGDPF
jgi:hypothetical protein